MVTVTNSSSPSASPGQAPVGPSLKNHRPSLRISCSCILSVLHPPPLLLIHSIIAHSEYHAFNRVYNLDFIVASLAEAAQAGLEVPVQAVVHVPDNREVWAARTKNLEKVYCCESQGLDRVLGAKNLEKNCVLWELWIRQILLVMRAKTLDYFSWQPTTSHYPPILLGQLCAGKCQWQEQNKPLPNSWE